MVDFSHSISIILRKSSLDNIISLLTIFHQITKAYFSCHSIFCKYSSDSIQSIIILHLWMSELSGSFVKTSFGLSSIELVSIHWRDKILTQNQCLK